MNSGKNNDYTRSHWSILIIYELVFSSRSLFLEAKYHRFSLKMVQDVEDTHGWKTRQIDTHGCKQTNGGYKKNPLVTNSDLANHVGSLIIRLRSHL